MSITRCTASRGADTEIPVREVVLSILKRAPELEGTVRSNNTPLYLFDGRALEERCRVFLDTFRWHLPYFEAFFAMKCSNHPWVLQEVVKAGLGLDVSSGLELESALAADCRKVLFSGPGKTEPELKLAAKNAESVTVLLDSFGELERLDRAALRVGTVVRAGVRITARDDGLWRKFGIPLDDLDTFLKQAPQCSGVHLCGLQFHTSWNLTPEAQTGFIARLGEALGKMNYRLVENLEFIDIGGGYWPEEGEWLLDTDSVSIGLVPGRHLIPAVPIRDFAREITCALKEHVFPIRELAVYAEPGRWIADRSMHIAVTVIDRKADDLVIVDGGTNIVGWERYEHDYVPVINLTRPSLTERPCLIAGALCTPHDIWGWSFFGERIEPGDVLLLPNQGAYTWSLRQEFIKPLAKVVRV